MRRVAYERVIEEEAERQAREVEKTRYRYNELMTLSYEQAMGWLENAQSSDFRPQDVIQIIKVHMDYLKAFETTETPREEVTWTEEEEAELTQIIREIEAEEKRKRTSIKTQAKTRVRRSPQTGRLDLSDARSYRPLIVCSMIRTTSSP